MPGLKSLRRQINGSGVAPSFSGWTLQETEIGVLLSNFHWTQNFTQAGVTGWLTHLNAGLRLAGIPYMLVLVESS